MVNAPKPENMYEIKMAPRIKACLERANIREWRNAEWIPIDVLQKATEICINDRYAPVYLQNLWFCLHRQIVRKPASTGYIELKVLFPPVRVEKNEKILSLLKHAKKQIGHRKFAELCGLTHWTIYSWFTKNYLPPITAIMKACQILRKNVWEVLDEVKLCGTKDRITFRNHLDNQVKKDLADLIDWLNTEGHIRINGWAITITQHKENRTTLEGLGRKFITVFGVGEDKIHIYEYRNLCCLYISSAVIKQLLILKYGLPLGSKSDVIKIKRVDWRTMANYLMAEGYFAFNGRGLMAGISSNSIDVREKIYTFLKNNGYHPSWSGDEKSRSVCVQRMEESLKLLYTVWPHLNKTKRRQALEILRKPATLARLRINIDKKTSALLKKTTKILGKKELIEMINREGEKYGIKYAKRQFEHWIYPGTERRVSLFIVWIACQVSKEDPRRFIQPYMYEMFRAAHVI